jgi:hypothetical protein
LLEELGDKRVDAIGAAAVRAFMAVIAKRGIQAPSTARQEAPERAIDRRGRSYAGCGLRLVAGGGRPRGVRRPTSGRGEGARSARCRPCVLALSWSGGLFRRAKRSPRNRGTSGSFRSGRGWRRCFRRPSEASTRRAQTFATPSPSSQSNSWETKKTPAAKFATGVSFSPTRSGRADSNCRPRRPEPSALPHS